MNPLEQRIQALENKIKLLEASTTIPFEIDTAFRDRLGIDDKTTLGASTKTVASETQAVNESGSGSYNVPKLFDGYFMTDGGLHIPYYNLT